LSGYYLGLDIGSISSKAVILNDRDIAAAAIMPSGVNHTVTASSIRAAVLEKAGLQPQDLKASTATGLANRNSGTDAFSGVMVCNARGSHFIFPSARTVIDIGGQGSQLIIVDQAGKVTNFNVSGMCATGSARLLQVVARIMQISLDDIGLISKTAIRPSSFSTSCSVFLETEVITRISQGDSPQDILAGIHETIAEKIGSMAASVTIQDDVVVIGGGALDAGLVANIGQKLGTKVLVPENPRLIAALGAAVISREKNSAN
jgi:predicted CoA-substrate-specific enzyme activase